MKRVGGLEVVAYQFFEFGRGLFGRWLARQASLDSRNLGAFVSTRWRRGAYFQRKRLKGVWGPVTCPSLESLPPAAVGGLLKKHPASMRWALRRLGGQRPLAEINLVEEHLFGINTGLNPLSLEIYWWCKGWWVFIRRTWRLRDAAYGVRLGREGPQATYEYAQALMRDISLPSLPLSYLGTSGVWAVSWERPHQPSRGRPLAVDIPSRAFIVAG